MKQEALKLADLMEAEWGQHWEDGADMIRKLVAELDKQTELLQQKDLRIHDLKTANDFHKTVIDGLTDELNKKGELVAWRVPYREVPDSKIEWALDCESDGKDYLLERVSDCELAWIGEPEPLYTAPQTKTLSDDEIEKLAKHYLDSDGYEVFGVMGFARAILKAADEIERKIVK